MCEPRTQSTAANEVDGPMTSLEVPQRLWGGEAKRLGGDPIAQTLRRSHQPKHSAVGTIGLFQTSSARRERRQ